MPGPFSSTGFGDERNNPVVLDEDDTVPQTPLTRTHIDNGNEDENDDSEAVEVVSLGEIARLKQLSARNKEARNLVSTITSPSGVVVITQHSYELFPEPGQEYSLFFLVKRIVKLSAQPGDVLVQGVLMARHLDVYVGHSKTTGEKLHSILPLGKNELCMQLRTTLGEIGSSSNSECLVEVPLSSIMQERRVVYTNKVPSAPNQPLPFNYETEGWRKSGGEKAMRNVEEHAVLCCRWKFTEEVDVQRRKVVAWQLLPLCENECDAGKASDSVPMRRQYGQQRLGRHNISSAAASTPSTNRDRPTSTPRQTGCYTHGDVCAGGGGTMKGAEQAGLKLQWALDNCPVAIKTIKNNFLQLDDVLERGVEELAQLVHTLPNLVVDVLHVSFPCKGHSYANRGTNPELDAKNNALVTALGYLLQLIRPRIVTLEQTNGICTKNDAIWFRKVIQQLKAAGYGARWKICDMKEYGVPCVRKRLMVMGFCPGERMPDWPQPTGIVTVGEAIRNIPADPKFHDIEAQKKRYAVHRYDLPVIDLNQPLRHTIKTDGVKGLLQDTDGKFYKPTIRQQACLMTFPVNHFFAGHTEKDYTTQIGNAVPCVFMEQLFLKIIESLKLSDSEAAQYERRLRENPVLIDE